MENKKIFEPIFTKFPQSTEIPEIYHPTQETNMKEPDLQHKLLLAEGTLTEIDKILISQIETDKKYMWIKIAMTNYHNHKQQIETQGYLSYKIEEES